VTRDRIELAAIAVFSAVGFDAASTYEIAKQAGVKQQLITYHYSTKLDLWKVVVDRVFFGFGERYEARHKGLEGVDRPSQLRLLLREFMLYSADHPEAARFMAHEGGSPGTRLAWLYERHSGPFFRDLLDLLVWAQNKGLAIKGDPLHLLYVFIGSVGMFTNRAEAELVCEEHSFNRNSDDQYINFVLGMLLPGIPTPDFCR